MDEHPHVPLEPYPCDKIVYRAALFPDWIQPTRQPTKQVKKEAFFRFEDDLIGVTVTPTPESCTDGLTRPTYGIISIKVGWLRDAGFDVVPDRLDHANITGVPIRSDGITIDSTAAAHKIAKIARPYIPNEAV